MPSYLAGIFLSSTIDMNLGRWMQMRCPPHDARWFEKHFDLTRVLIFFLLATCLYFGGFWTECCAVFLIVSYLRALGKSPVLQLLSVWSENRIGLLIWLVYGESWGSAGGVSRYFECVSPVCSDGSLETGGTGDTVCSDWLASVVIVELLVLAMKGHVMPF